MGTSAGTSMCQNIAWPVSKSALIGCSIGWCPKHHESSAIYKLSDRLTDCLTEKSVNKSKAEDESTKERSVAERVRRSSFDERIRRHRLASTTRKDTAEKYQNYQKRGTIPRHDQVPHSILST